MYIHVHVHMLYSFLWKESEECSRNTCCTCECTCCVNAFVPVYTSSLICMYMHVYIIIQLYMYMYLSFLPPPSPSVVIQWSSPPSLPQDSHVTYHIYVNRVYKETVEGSAGTMSAHLRDIPRQQLVKISVRTVTNEGESADPKKLIILNPRE